MVKVSPEVRTIIDAFMAGKYDKRAAREAFLATLPDAATAPTNSLNLGSPVSRLGGTRPPRPGEPNIPNLGSPVSPTWGQQQNPSLSNLGTGTAFFPLWVRKLV